MAINGCCYGKDNRPDKNGVYYKYCGQVFWEFISNDPDLYVKLIEPLGFKAKEKNNEYIQSYARIVNKFTLDFSTQFCSIKGDIDWVKLVEFNSGAQ